MCTDFLRYSERYSRYTHSHYKTMCKRIIKAWGPDTDVAAITNKMCLEYLDSRALISGNCANEDRKRLSAMWNHWIEYDGLQSNPISKIPSYSHEETPQYTPPKKDIQSIVMVTKDQDRAIIDVFRYTGARRSEVYRLTWDDVLFDQKQIRLKTRKTKKGTWRVRFVHMGPTLYESIKRQWDRRDKESPYVFTRDGKRYGKRDEWLPALCKKAGVKPFSYHALRRYRGSTLMDMGASLKEVQEQLGHTSLRHTEKYIHTINPRLKELMEVEDEILEKSTPGEGTNEA